MFRIHYYETEILCWLATVRIQFLYIYLYINVTQRGSYRMCIVILLTLNLNCIYIYIYYVICTDIWYIYLFKSVSGLFYLIIEGTHQGLHYAWTVNVESDTLQKKFYWNIYILEKMSHPETRMCYLHLMDRKHCSSSDFVPWVLKLEWMDLLLNLAYKTLSMVPRMVLYKSTVFKHFCWLLVYYINSACTINLWSKIK